MQEDVECLLELLDKTPKHALTGREIKDELKDRKIPPDIFDKLILECFESGLITPTIPAQKTEASNLAYIDSISYVLTAKGLEYLNQIRIKTAIEKLDSSINKFNVSSDKYSKKLIELTYAVYVFTILVVALPIYEKSIQLFNVSPVAEIVWLLIGIVVIAESMLIYYNKVWKKE